MSKIYNAQFRYNEDEISDEEYEGILAEFEELDQVEIETRKDELQEARLSEPATIVALTATAVVVHGTDVLVSLYQIARSHHAFAGVSLQDGDGNEILPVGRDYIDAGAVGEESVIVTVKGDINVEGDVYLVEKSAIDRMKNAETETDHEE